MKKLNRNTIMSQLYKEFKKLEKGKTVNINIPLKSMTVPVHISWQEDTSAQFEFDDVYEKSYEQIDICVEKLSLPLLNEYNQQIKNFIAKCDGFASQLGEDEHQFFDLMMDYGMNKESKLHHKKLLTKQIKETEIRLNKLKSKLELVSL